MGEESASGAIETPVADTGLETQDNVVSADAQTSDKVQKTAQVEDDPEIEFAKDFKIKKSEAGSRLQKLKELERGAHEKFQQAATLRQQTNSQLEKLISALEQDPSQVYKHFGKDFEAVLQREVSRRVAEAGMSPEQKAAHAEKQELERLRTEQKAWEAQRKEQEQVKEQAQWEQRIEAAFVPVIEQAGLPKDWSTVARMARYSEWYLERGEEPPLPQIAQRVSQDYQDEMNSVLGAATPEQIEKLVPKEIREKWRLSELKKVQAKSQPPQRNVAQVPAQSSKKTWSQSEWNKRFSEI